MGDSGVGDTATNAITDAQDESGARLHPAALFTNIPVTNIYDYNRDAKVDSLDESVSRLNTTNFATHVKYINLTTAPAAPQADGGTVSPLVATDSTSGDSDAARGLAAPLNVAPSVAGVPAWITTRLASVDLNSGVPARLFQHLHDANTPGPRALLQKFDAAADALGLDDELLDSLLADLGLE